MDNSLPAVSIIMPVFNEAAHIRHSLGAVLDQDYPPDRMEILVVDGGSQDKTREIVQNMICNPVNGKLLDNPERIQAAGLNIGILAAQGEVIVRVDGHTIIAPDYVRTCVDYLLRGQADNVGGLMRPYGTTYSGRGIALATTSPFGNGGSKFHYSEREQFVDTVYLGAYWRRTFDEIGLYGKDVNINEDYEFNYRLRKAGGKILLSPTVKSTYIPRSSLVALWRQYFKYGRQKVRTLKKYPASVRLRQVISPLFVAVIIGSLVLSLFWPAARPLFVIAAGSYLLVNLAASTIAAKYGGWRYLFILPLIFGCIHFAWGLGFWWGVVSVAFGTRQ